MIDGGLLNDAAVLEGEAVKRETAALSSDHPDPQINELRQRAAELKRQALGPRPYPVLICAACFCLTGWLDTSGVCAADALRRLRQADQGFPDVRDLRVPFESNADSGLAKVRRALRLSTAHDRVREWLKQVDPDETGPIAPEESWELEAPLKYQWPAPEGQHLLLRFESRTVRFESSIWQPVAVGRAGKPRKLMPREFAASLRIDLLAEAWTDFQEEIASHNRQLWDTESREREARQIADAGTQSMKENEEGTDRLLG